MALFWLLAQHHESDFGTKSFKAEAQIDLSHQPSMAGSLNARMGTAHEIALQRTSDY